MFDRVWATKEGKIGEQLETEFAEYAYKQIQEYGIFMNDVYQKVRGFRQGKLDPVDTAYDVYKMSKNFKNRRASMRRASRRRVSRRRVSKRRVSKRRVSKRRKKSKSNRRRKGSKRSRSKKKSKRRKTKSKSRRKRRSKSKQRKK